MLFRLEGVGKEFSGEWLLEDLSVQCNPGDRIGLIGQNGVGKTTLFNLVEGLLYPDRGSILRASDFSVARVPQIPQVDSHRSVFDETVTVFGYLEELETRLREIEHQISDTGITPELAQEYEKVRHRFEFEGGYDYRARTEKVLFGLGFTAPDLALECYKLSGGQRSRLLLARVLLMPSSLLLLDEPTNHLDLNAILWLSDFLTNRSAAFVVVSHDRYFLDAVTDTTWELEAGSLYEYPASYTRSRRFREERIRLERLEYERQQEWRRQTEDFVRRNIVGQKTRQAQSRRKRLQKTDWMEKPVEESEIPVLKIPEAPRGGAQTLELREVSIGFKEKVLIEEVNLAVFRGDRIGLLGGNGTGKTSLLRVMAGELEPRAGDLHWGQNNVIAYFAQESQFRSPDQTVFEVLCELHPALTDEEIRSYGALFLFRKDDIFKPVRHLSGGERSRLSLARLFSRSSNVLLLDEPTNHLDVYSRQALEGALGGFEGTIIVTSHDLYFLERVVDQFYLIRDRRLEPLSSLKDLPERIRPPGGEKGERTQAPSAQKREKEAAGLSKNEQRRLERQLNELEALIEMLEGEQSECESRLSVPISDHLILRETSERYQEVRQELGGLYEVWEELSRKLEEGR